MKYKKEMRYYLFDNGRENPTGVSQTTILNLTKDDGVGIRH